jgi:predicted nuclease of predicted toxin-antitoxin system
MKILIDMNLSPEWCRVLDGHGHSSIALEPFARFGRSQ